jgi:hypothetical protein
MTQKLYNDIMSFASRVGQYIMLEYDSVYYDYFDQNNLKMFDFIGSYYMGGNTVPDTARYVVELILMKHNGQA